MNNQKAILEGTIELYSFAENGDKIIENNKFIRVSRASIIKQLEYHNRMGYKNNSLYKLDGSIHIELSEINDLHGRKMNFSGILNPTLID